MNSKCLRVLVLILLFFSIHLLTTCSKSAPTEAEPEAIIDLNIDSMSFTSILYGSIPAAQFFKISNSGGGVLDWNVISNFEWLLLAYIPGPSNNSLVTVFVNSTGMNLGQHDASISISSTNAGNSPQVIDVSYTINVVSLSGTYDGTYRVITGYNTPSADTSFSTLELRLSDESYWFDSDNSPDNFCSPRGSYILSNNIEITENQSGCNVTADGRNNPRGTFSYRIPGDSLIMLQLSSDTLKHIQLLRR